VYRVKHVSSEGRDDAWLQRRSELLHCAFDWPNNERDARLRAACAGDDVMWHEIHRLLDADAQPHALLDQSAADLFAACFASADVDDGALAAGYRIGPYRLVDKLGEGGMGSVWEAQRADGMFEQTVAIKVIRFGMDSRAVKIRFRRERELLARLSHPNIARLFDGGITEDGQAYFVMEKIIGEPLMHYVTRHRPTLRQRLRLFVPLCEAVAYAHRQLIVHRDVKPSNILVRHDGSPVLLDFGIAKALDSDADDFIATQPFLTRAYASPEQLRGEPASTATDVYSLGSVLFELLTEHRHVASGTATAPSRISTTAMTRSLRADVDIIVMKALANAPTHRYPTVQALLDDVQRLLDGQSILARPPSIFYRTRRFVERHRYTVALGMSLMLLLFFGFAFLLNRHIQKERESDRAAAMQLSVAAAMQATRAPPQTPMTNNILTLLANDPIDEKWLAARRRARAYIALAEGFQQLDRYEEAYRNYSLALESLQAERVRRNDSDDPISSEFDGLTAAARETSRSPGFSLSTAEWFAHRSSNVDCKSP